MKVKVYHAKNPTFGLPEGIKVQVDGKEQVTKTPAFPADYEMVAELELGQVGKNLALELAFMLTNHIDHDWTRNKEVISRAQKSLRSTSTGDVVELEDGTKWLCENIGWKQI